MILEVELGLIVRQSAERAEIGLLCLNFERRLALSMSSPLKRTFTEVMEALPFRASAIVVMPSAV